MEIIITVIAIAAAAVIVVVATKANRNALPIKRRMSLTPTGWNRVNDRLADNGGGGWYMEDAA